MTYASGEPVLSNRAYNVIVMAGCALLLQLAACAFPTKRQEQFALDHAGSSATGDGQVATPDPEDGGDATTGVTMPTNTARADAAVGTSPLRTTPSSSKPSSQKPDSGAVADDAGADEVQCAADLAACLLADPLGYANCLRVSAEHHCTVADSLTPQIATNDKGEPLSAACQAQLADCITQDPTPDNAANCQEAANMCAL